MYFMVSLLNSWLRIMLRRLNDVRDRLISTDLIPPVLFKVPFRPNLLLINAALLMPLRSRIQTRFLSLPAPLIAAVAMMVASLLFAGLSAIVRDLGETMHPFEVTFFRNLAGLAFMLPWLARHGIGAMRTGRLWLYFWRSGLSLVSMLCNFTSLVLLPFAQAIALSFTTPLFATIGAALILG